MPTTLSREDQELLDFLRKVTKAFYDHVYKDPWLKKVFALIPQENIQSQQAEFMLGAFGGEKIYSGRSPKDAHPHIYVDEEMWNLREHYLRLAFTECAVPKEMQERWIKVDEAFKKFIVKKSHSDCQPRFKLDPLIIEENPVAIKKAA